MIFGLVFCSILQKLNWNELSKYIIFKKIYYIQKHIFRYDLPNLIVISKNSNISDKEIPKKDLITAKYSFKAMTQIQDASLEHKLIFEFIF